jgi:chondroitin 4-sulfotransferase 11
MIIYKYNTIFIHIPKNAGTSIETYFKNKNFKKQPRKHADIEDIKKDFLDLYRSYDKFAIIRNPYDRMVSWYFFIKHKLTSMEKTYKMPPFDDWIKDPSKYWKVIRDPIGFLKPQYEWIDETVEIIKFENIHVELNNFFKKIGNPYFRTIDLPIINKSKHKHYLEYYNKKSLDVVYNKYKKDFKYFNYKKI